MKKCDPNHSHDRSVAPTVPNLDKLVGRKNGIFIAPAIIEQEVGEELILFLRDKRPTIEKLVEIGAQRVNLWINAGVETTLAGPVTFILIWVTDVNDPSETPIVSSIKFLNPDDQAGISFWRRLADAGHWHLILMVRNEWHSIIEYKNERDKFKLNQKLDEVIQSYSEFPRGANPVKAQELLMQEVTIEELIQRPPGRSTKFLVLKKSHK